MGATVKKCRFCVCLCLVTFPHSFLFFGQKDITSDISPLGPINVALYFGRLSFILFSTFCSLLLTINLSFKGLIPFTLNPRQAYYIWVKGIKPCCKEAAFCFLHWSPQKMIALWGGTILRGQFLLWASHLVLAQSLSWASFKWGKYPHIQWLQHVCWNLKKKKKKVCWMLGQHIDYLNFFFIFF